MSVLRDPVLSLGRSSSCVNEFTCRGAQVFLNSDCALHDELLRLTHESNNLMLLQEIPQSGIELV
jgi:hypothetical protein